MRKASGGACRVCYGEHELAMPTGTLSPSKQARIESLADARGVIAALAMDQRRSLRKMIAQAAGVAESAVCDEQLVEFKCAVSAMLTSHASAVLLDPEYGLPATGLRAEGCGLLMTYEADGYENPRPNRMLALMPEQSVRRLRDAEAQAIKILLSYTPEEPESAKDEKRVMIERIGSECQGLEMPFLLEPVVYDARGGGDPRSVEYARKKPGWVVETVAEFSQERYGVDVLKVEFPVVAAYVEGSRVWRGETAQTMNEAMEWYRRADEAAGACPYIYLSAGVSNAEFTESLRLAAEAGARFSGVLCGRANWQEGIPVFVERGRSGLEEWLAGAAVENMRAVNACLAAAVPWFAR
jgi:tagatose 1,6-diphosphate aldolase